MEKISIIIPVYKVENYLEQCLKSVMNQTLEDIEIIVVDEGEYDRCREIIDEAAAKDKRIIALHDKHGGYGNSVNSGIARATGKYIGFVESDDFIEPWMYEILYNKAEELNADITKSAFYYFFDNKKEELAPLMSVLRRDLPKNKAFTLEEYPVLLATHPSIWTGLYKREWLQNTGIQFLPKGAYLDIRFRFETLMKAAKIAWIDEATYHWRLTNPTSTNASWNINAALERWEFLHAQFIEKPNLWKRFAPYMLVEEYKNLFGKYSLRNCTSGQRKQIREYHKLYSNDMIKACPFLSDEIKRRYLNGSLGWLAIKRGFSKLKDILRKVEFREFSIAIWLASLITKQLTWIVTIPFFAFWVLQLWNPVCDVLKILKKGK